MPHSSQYQPNINSFLPQNGHFYAHNKHRNNATGNLFPPLTPRLVTVTNNVTHPGNIRPIRVNRQRLFTNNRPCLAAAATKLEAPTNVYQLPNSLIDVVRCPIQYASLSDPVITPSGITYHRQDIEQWLKTKESDPSTRESCLLSDLRENKIILKIQQLINSIEKASDVEKEILYESLIRLFYDSKGKLITNPVVNVGGNTEQSEQDSPKYKNHIFLDIMNSTYIDEIMKKVKEKKEGKAIQTSSPEV